MSQTSEVNIREAAAPRSDQTNYEDMTGSPMTIRVTEVRAGSKEQPIEVHYEGGDGRPFKPCKSMLRVLIAAWGDKGADWVGRSMVLYGDADVRFGGVAVGGIRISHVSHIDQPISVLLSTSRGKRKPYMVKPLKTPAKSVQKSAQKDRAPEDPAGQLLIDAAFERLIAAMEAVLDADNLADIIAAEDMNRYSESQRNQARELYVQRRDALTN